MAKRKASEVLWLALGYAIQDRISLIDAYSSIPDDPVVKEAMQDMADIKALQMRLFGTTKSRIEAAIEKMTPISLVDFLAKMDTEEDWQPFIVRE